MASPGGRHVRSEPSITRRGALDKRADRGMRAYVTGSDDARRACERAVRERSGSRHIALGELDGSPHASGVKPRASRTARWRRSRVGLRGTAGDACASLQAPPPKVATLRAARTRWSPSYLTGRATANRSRARTPRRSRHPEVAPGVSIPRQAREPLRRSRRVSVRDRGNENNIARSLSKNPALASSANTGPPLAGCLPTGRLKDGRLRLHRLKDGETSLRPSWGRP